MTAKTVCLIILFFVYGVIVANAEVTGEKGSGFIFSQLKFSGNWDPHPDAFRNIKHYLINTTSVNVFPERRVVELNDEILFCSPFLLFIGRGSYPPFSEKEIIILRRYIEGGGIIFIDTAADIEFSKSVARTMRRVFPDKDFKKIPHNHAIFKAFYLIDYVSGQTINKPYLEGIKSGSKIAVIKSANDLIAVWPRDRFGNWRHQLVPDRAAQRKEAIKLTLNILVYSVSGTYKSDPVHQPAIKRKLGR